VGGLENHGAITPAASNAATQANQKEIPPDSVRSMSFMAF
jgi:hypothetical protein